MVAETRLAKQAAERAAATRQGADERAGQVCIEMGFAPVSCFTLLQEPTR